MLLFEQCIHHKTNTDILTGQVQKTANLTHSCEYPPVILDVIGCFLYMSYLKCWLKSVLWLTDEARNVLVKRFLLLQVNLIHRTPANTRRFLITGREAYNNTTQTQLCLQSKNNTTLELEVSVSSKTLLTSLQLQKPAEPVDLLNVTI